ncbi:MAG TPA: hypothetical protein DEO59_17780 [Balneola sp.]|jgi:hypothetical protein|nr:hypothetical protein [Balneola sp.]MAO78121.1 hypothetical protein [Balneola sp.]MBF64122.1 hypothetical protein [Balneola sp.]HAD49934.1 hypothetical protein [Algoriphagus sp.]HBZ40232.1 hypothetical protein [Balneola sp.]|tara:strand:+ start:2749 stop:2973 length:225 start_codon:yes stop_codon:yes gene_type:complete
MLKKGLLLFFSIAGAFFLLSGINSLIALQNIQSNSTGLGEFAYWAGGWVSILFSAILFLSAFLLYKFNKPKNAL